VGGVAWRGKWQRTTTMTLWKLLNGDGSANMDVFLSWAPRCRILHAAVPAVSSDSKTRSMPSLCNYHALRLV
jgi:hypothetical protein